jgi:hypothetical protein
VCFVLAGKCLADRFYALQFRAQLRRKRRLRRSEFKRRLIIGSGCRQVSRPRVPIALCYQGGHEARIQAQSLVERNAFLGGRADSALHESKTIPGACIGFACRNRSSEYIARALRLSRSQRREACRGHRSYIDCIVVHRRKLNRSGRISSPRLDIARCPLAAEN